MISIHTVTCRYSIGAFTVGMTDVPERVRTPYPEGKMAFLTIGPVETVGKPPGSWNASKRQVQAAIIVLLWQLITILEILVPLFGNFLM